MCNLRMVQGLELDETVVTQLVWWHSQRMLMHDLETDQETEYVITVERHDMKRTTASKLLDILNG